MATLTIDREQIERDAERMLSVSKTKLVLSKDAKAVFFATLVMRLNFRADWTIDTAATDGRNLYYNPAFVTGLPADELQGVLAHEVMHCVLKHFARRGDREQKRFNVAADLAINPLLTESGYKLPGIGCFPGKKPFETLPVGLSAEEYYVLLTDEMMKQGGGEDGSDPGGCGGVMDAVAHDGSPAGDASARQLDAEWSANVAAAQQQASKRGALPAGLDLLCRATLEPTVDWRHVLREFITRPCKDDYNWRRPSRRWLAHGLYLPSRHSLRIGRIAVAIDTSGSIGDDTLTRFASEVADVARQNVEAITTIYHDAAVCRVDEWTPDDGEYTLTPCGGGGTDHRPVFEYVATMEEPPVLLICLTDLYSVFPSAPDYPVLWVSTTNQSHPFGERVNIPAE